MNPLLSALQFLTILPLKTKTLPDSRAVGRMLVCFPLAGFLIGLLLAGANLLFSFVFPDFAVNVMLVVFLAFITGGLHLDGLADTFDGIMGGNDKTKILEIMRDSRIGTMGVLSLISLFALKFAFLSTLPITLKTSALILMPAVSRWSMLVPLAFFNYARENGKAKEYFTAMNRKLLIIATLVTFVPAYFIVGGLSALCLMAATGLIAYFFSTAIKRKIDGITGDTLGAVNEINELGFLIVLSVLASYALL